MASAGDVVRGLQMLLPDKKQAVVVLINANTELPFNEVNAVLVPVVIALVALAWWAWAWAHRAWVRSQGVRPP